MKLTQLSQKKNSLKLVAGVALMMLSFTGNAEAKWSWARCKVSCQTNIIRCNPQCRIQCPGSVCGKAQQYELEQNQPKEEVKPVMPEENFREEGEEDESCEEKRQACLLKSERLYEESGRSYYEYEDKLEGDQFCENAFERCQKKPEAAEGGRKEEAGAPLEESHQESPTEGANRETPPLLRQGRERVLKQAQEEETPLEESSQENLTEGTKPTPNLLDQIRKGTKLRSVVTNPNKDQPAASPTEPGVTAADIRTAVERRQAKTPSVSTKGQMQETAEDVIAALKANPKLNSPKRTERMKAKMELMAQYKQEKDKAKSAEDDAKYERILDYLTDQN